MAEKYSVNDKAHESDYKFVAWHDLKTWIYHVSLFLTTSTKHDIT